MGQRTRVFGTFAHWNGRAHLEGRDADAGRTRRRHRPGRARHGESAKPMEDSSLGAHASGLRDLLITLGVSSARLIGHSFGGGAAMQVTDQHPDPRSDVDPAKNADQISSPHSHEMRDCRAQVLSNPPSSGCAALTSATSNGRGKQARSRAGRISPSSAGVMTSCSDTVRSTVLRCDDDLRRAGGLRRGRRW